MILDKEVTMKVHNRTARIYENKGYVIPKRMGSKGKMVYDTDKYFTVRVSDLEPTSTVPVNTECDICNRKKTMPYRDYYRQLDKNGLCTCQKCKTIKYRQTVREKYGEGIISTSQLDSVKEKAKATFQERYGVNWNMQRKEAQEKRKQTYLEKYGCEWPNQNPEIKQKTAETNLKKYGVKNPAMTQEVQEKMKKTSLERYGYEMATQSPLVKEKIAKTNIERYGSKCSLGSKEIYQKAVASRYENGNVAVSKQQLYLYSLYGGELNYPCSTYNLDIVIDNIDIEYDGGGHALTVLHNNMSEHDFEVKQIVRDKIVKSHGYKILRLISETDKLPSDEILLQILEISKQYFKTTNHTWYEWYFDKNMYRNAENKGGVFFDFGELRNTKKTDIA